MQWFIQWGLASICGRLHLTAFTSPLIVHLCLFSLATVYQLTVHKFLKFKPADAIYLSVFHDDGF